MNNNYVLENSPATVREFREYIGDGDCGDYQITNGNTGKFKEIVREVINLIKTKDITVREAQEVFLICSDYVMNCKCD